MAFMPSLSVALRRELLDYLLATSSDRARMIAKLADRNPDMLDLLLDLEDDDDLRARLEMDL